jgi:hypothetical protein
MPHCQQASGPSAASNAPESIPPSREKIPEKPELVEAAGIEPAQRSFRHDFDLSIAIVFAHMPVTH